MKSPPGIRRPTVVRQALSAGAGLVVELFSAAHRSAALACKSAPRRPLRILMLRQRVLKHSRCLCLFVVLSYDGARLQASLASEPPGAGIRQSRAFRLSPLGAMLPWLQHEGRLRLEAGRVVSICDILFSMRNELGRPSHRSLLIPAPIGPLEVWKRGCP